MISYAQNFEDVMLWRALGHVERGFYVDIGAQDPLVDSVSLAFHERGWHGIHVEPATYYAALLSEQRPGDTVLQVAIGEPPGDMPFFEIPDTGISTLSPEIASRHRLNGYDVNETTATVVPLASILTPCDGQDVHWLKIDVEGFERQVLSSWGTCSVRPWVVVVESTSPLTQIETYLEWEPLLFERGYSFNYFDGLNRFYVAADHQDLTQAFSVPPNVFDEFSFNGTASTKFHEVAKARYEAQIDIALKAQAESHQKQRLALKRRHARRERRLSAQIAILQQQRNREAADATTAQAQRDGVLHDLSETVAREIRAFIQTQDGRVDGMQHQWAGLHAEIAAMKQTLDVLLQNIRPNVVAPSTSAIPVPVESPSQDQVQQTEPQQPI